MKQKGDLDDAWEISAFLTYFQENHTVVLGNWIFLKNTSRYSFNLDGKTLRTLLVYLTSIILKEAGESNLKLFAFIDIAKIDFQ